MDPVGFVSSLVTLIDVTAKVIGYLKSVQDAPADRMEVFEKLSGLHNLLIIFQNRVQEAKQGDPWLTSVRALGISNGPLDHFKDSLERLSKKLQDGEGLKKLKKMLTWKIEKGEVKEMLSEMERIKSYIALALQNDHFTLSQEIKRDLSKMDSGISTIQTNQKEEAIRSVGIKSNISNVIANQRSQTRQNTIMLTNIEALQSAQLGKECLEIGEWLSKLNFWNTQSEHFSKCSPGTGAWFLNSDEFKDWKNGSHRTLWCPGNPGAGKTIIASIAVNHLLELFKEDDIAIACIYCDYKQQVDQTAPELAANLLKQLVQQRSQPSAAIKALYNRHRLKGSRPTATEVKNALELEIKSYSRVFVIIDALDECREDGGTRSRLLAMLKQLPKSVQLLVTSRDISSIEEEYDWDRKLTIFANDEDLDSYINDRLTSESRLMRLIKGSSNLSQEIVAKIIENTKGMFLLARLHMDALASKTNRKALLDAIRTLPKEINATYDEAMERIEKQSEDDRELANQIFSWLTHVVRSLSILELQHALAVTPDMEELDIDAIVDQDILTSVCAGLVVVDEESQLIRLVHYTTQEYFEQTRQVRYPDAQSHITRICLTYVSTCGSPDGAFVDLDELNAYRDANPFYEYAACYWGVHGRTESTNEVVLQFLQHSSQLVCATQSLLNSLDLDRQAEGFPLELSDIHAAAVFGLDNIIRYLLQNGVDPNSTDSNGRTPLSYAVQCGNVDTVKELLDTEGIGADMRDWMGLTPLSYAASKGQDQIARMLLSRNDVSADSKSRQGRTPLSLAAESGHETLIGILLARNDVDVNSKDTEGHTPLHYASEKGNHTIVKAFLSRRDIQADAADDLGQTPLFAAADNGSISVAKLLLDHGTVQADKRDEEDETPLFYAVQAESLELVRLLLNRDDVQADAKSSMGMTPLMQAVAAENVGAVKLLLRRDDVAADSKDDLGRSPLSYAAESNNDTGKVTDIIKLLLARDDVAIDSRDDDGRTPLSHAIGSGRLEAMEILLEHDQRVDEKDTYQRTPLSHAAYCGWALPVVQRLLDRDDVDPDSGDREGRTPLSFAAASDEIEIVKLLLAKERVLVNSMDNEGRTPFSYACGEGTPMIVKLLLEQEGITLDLKDKTGRTPLSYAAESDEAETVQILLEQDGIDVQSKDNSERTLLSYAAEGGCATNVKLLLDNGAMADHPDKSGKTPLAHAAEYGHVAVMKLLLEHGVTSIDSKDRAGRTPLSRAAESRTAAAVKLLLQRNVNLNSKDNKGRTPLSYAVDCDEAPVVRMLLGAPGIDPGIEDNEGRTAVWFAAGDECEERFGILKLLLENGKANPGKATNKGLTPLWKAARHGFYASVELLLAQENIGDINHKVGGTESALLAAAARGHRRVVELLLAREDVDVNVRSKEEITPLMLAASRGHITVVERLLAHKKIDIRAKSKNGNTALVFAVRGGHKLVESMLRERLLSSTRT